LLLVGVIVIDVDVVCARARTFKNTPATPTTSPYCANFLS